MQIVAIDLNFCVSMTFCWHPNCFLFTAIGVVMKWSVILDMPWLLRPLRCLLQVHGIVSSQGQWSFSCSGNLLKPWWLSTTPPKFNITPGEIDGWKTILSSWSPIYFQVLYLKLPGSSPRNPLWIGLLTYHRTGKNQDEAPTTASPCPVFQYLVSAWKYSYRHLCKHISLK